MSKDKYILTDAQREDAARRFLGTDMVDYTTAGGHVANWRVQSEVNQFAAPSTYRPSDWVLWAATILGFLTDGAFMDSCLYPSSNGRVKAAQSIEELKAHFEEAAAEADQIRIDEQADPECAPYWHHHPEGEHAWGNDTMDTARRWLADAESPYNVWRLFREVENAAQAAVRDNLLALSIGKGSPEIARASEAKLDEILMTLDKHYEEVREAEARETSHKESWDAHPLAY